MSEKKKERRGLGRGLSALMADVNVAETTNPAIRQENAQSGSERQIEIHKIHPNLDQPRKEFEKGKLEELAASVKEKGIIQPLILRPHPSKPDDFEIVAGERRWRAAQIAQLHEVPVIVRDYSETEVLEIAIIENIQRAELNSIEEAAGYKLLMERFGHTQEKLSEALGKSRSHIANLLRLLNLPGDVQSLVVDGSLSAGHARALVTAADAAGLAKQIVKKGLSVRATEALVKNEGKTQTSTVTKSSGKDADTLALEGDLSAAIGMKVQIDHGSNGESGKVTVSYKDLDQLDQLCALLSTVQNS